MKQFVVCLFWVGLFFVSAISVVRGINMEEQMKLPLPVMRNGSVVDTKALMEGENMLSMGRSSFGKFLTAWNPNWKGEHIIPYTLDIVNPQDRALVEWGLANIQRGSNLKFVVRTNERAYIEIRQGVRGSGCWAQLGKQEFAPNIINLAEGSCFWHSAPQHEALHALGFLHEQQRLDRDDHIIVKSENVESDPVNFAKSDSGSTDKPFDYNSIMLYRGFFRARDPKLQPNIDKTGITLSSCDWNLLNTLYPGPKKPPVCHPTEVDDVCEPMPSCTGYNCDWQCKYDCSSQLGKTCRFKGGGRFPQDAMWRVEHQNAPVAERTPLTEVQCAALRKVYFGVSAKKCIEAIGLETFCAAEFEYGKSDCWQIGSLMKSLLSFPECKFDTSICANAP